MKKILAVKDKKMDKKGKFEKVIEKPVQSI